MMLLLHSSGYLMPDAVPTSNLELCLLGHARVRANGFEINFATRKALGLLAYLALEGATSRSKLADLFWSDMNEDAARNNLRKEVFRLRETPLREFLEVSPSSLNLSDVTLDVQAFLEAEDHAALELYGGDFLAGVEVAGATRFEAWLEEKRESLRARFARLLATQALQLESAGDLRAALETRLKLLETDSLQESFHREVMRLHWRLGERSLALARFSGLEQMLETELGLKPLPTTLALLRNIENSSSESIELEQPATASRVPALHRPPFIGRDDEWAWLEARTHGLALVKGEAGVGKTRLIEDLTRMHGLAITLRGFENAAGTPFYPVAETLRGLLETQKLDTLEPVWKREAARLVPEFDAGRNASNLPSSEGRARFIEGLSRALLCALQPGDALILDDLHWFDTSSLELIAHLIRRAPNQTRIIASARPLELSENKEAKTVLTALERDGLLEQLELQPFNIAQTLSLVQALSGGRATLFSSRLHQATGGNALFALETLRGLFENNLLKLEDDGTWATPFDDATEDYTELPIPPNVRDLVLARLERLGPACTRLLEAASIAFEPFEAGWLEGATALSEWENLEGLERAINAAVLIPEGAGYRFGHDLTRRALRTTLSPERTRLIHRKFAHNLAQENTNSARIAEHLEGGDRKPEAILWRIKAARAAQTVFAHVEARAHYERALELLPETQTAFQIHKALSELELTLMNLNGLEAHANAMLELATQDTTLEIQARLMLARHGIYRGQYTQALQEAEHAHNLTGKTGTYAAESLLLGGTALVGCGRLTDAETRLQNGLKLEKRPNTEMYGELHSVLKEVYRQQGNLPKALEHARASHAAYQKIGKHDSEITMLAQIGQMLGAMGQSEEALAMLEKAVRQAREMRFERVLSFALVIKAEEMIQNGGFENAESVVIEGLELSRGKILARECQFTNMLARIKRRTGRFGEAIQVAKKALILSDELGLPVQQVIQLLFIADVYLDLGATKLAQFHLEKTSDLIEQAGLTVFSLSFETLQARMEIIQQKPKFALKRLEKKLLTLNQSPTEHRLMFVTILAQAQFEVGNFTQALFILNDFFAPTWLEARAHSLQLEARLASKVKTRALKEQLLATEKFFELRRIPKLESFQLQITLKKAYEFLQQKDAAKKIQDSLTKLKHELVQSFELEPDLQQHFLEQYSNI
jgi:DNA-binding SARP family transcriptional activator/tetratricopeptide (TPR) repeat protein